MAEDRITAKPPYSGDFPLNAENGWGMRPGAPLIIDPSSGSETINPQDEQAWANNKARKIVNNFCQQVGYEGGIALVHQHETTGQGSTRSANMTSVDLWICHDNIGAVEE